MQNTIMPLINVLSRQGRERAHAEDIPFKLTQDDLSLIAKDQIESNARFLAPETIEHYERLMFSAVMYCNRVIAGGDAASVVDALLELNAARSAHNYPISVSA